MTTLPLRLLGVGPQRTGSTWLDAQLRRHSDLALPTNVKETFFFDRHWARGAADYASHFPEAHVAWAEVGPTYFDDPEVPERVCSLAADVHIVVTLRDPLDRAVSLFQHHHRKGRVPDSFDAAAAAIPRIVTAGDYADHLPRWLRVFGAGRVHVVLLDDITEDPARVLADLMERCGLAALAPSDDAGERVNAASAPRFPALAGAAARAVTLLRDARLHRVVEVGKRLGLKRVYRGGGAPPEATSDERARLAARYRPHVEYVESLLDRELDWARA